MQCERSPLLSSAEARPAARTVVEAPRGASPELVPTLVGLTTPTRALCVAVARWTEPGVRRVVRAVRGVAAHCNGPMTPRRRLTFSRRDVFSRRDGDGLAAAPRFAARPTPGVGVRSESAGAEGMRRWA